MGCFVINPQGNELGVGCSQRAGAPSSWFFLGCASGCRSASLAGGAKLRGWLLVHLSSSTDCEEMQRDARPV